MKKQITEATMMLSIIAPAMANGLDNQAFEDQVFHTRADSLRSVGLRSVLQHKLYQEELMSMHEHLNKQER
ncbi:TPA: hypothetical protein ACJJ9I_002164 [Neisseria meningitidis]